MKREAITHEFVEFIPDELADGVLYVSMEYATATHLCCCGCGREVSTQISPTDWRLTFDGESISLYPSLGRWSWPCKSHYWIERNRVRWDLPMSPEEIEAGRGHDRARKAAYYGDTVNRFGGATDTAPADSVPLPPTRRWSRLWRPFSR
jgi:hypothetical protein